jgi:hypothetical protein
MRAWVPSGSRAKKASSPLPRSCTRRSGAPAPLRLSKFCGVGPEVAIVPIENGLSGENMEAAGIEPASADAPGRASTSLVRRLRSPGGRLTDDLPPG